MELFGSWVAGGNSSVGRKKDDFYPTPSECVYSLIKYIDIPKKVWSPACGLGGISKPLEELGHEVISTDLFYRGYGEGNIDFLKCKEKMADCVIENPPFNLAEQFIVKCKELDISVFCMLLKSQYWHAAKRVKLFNEIKPSKVLAMTWRPDFLGGGSPTMDCIWTCWEKGITKTEYFPIQKATK